MSNPYWLFGVGGPPGSKLVERPDSGFQPIPERTEDSVAEGPCGKRGHGYRNHYVPRHSPRMQVHEGPNASDLVTSQGPSRNLPSTGSVGTASQKIWHNICGRHHDSEHNGSENERCANLESEA